MKRKPLVILAAVVVVILIILAALPLLINVDRFRPQLESQLSSALGRDVHIGKLSLSAFAGHVTASELSISDDPAFSRDPFITAKELEVNASLMPLLTGRLQVSSVTLVEPVVTLIHSPQGKWNFSSLGNTAEPGAKKKPGAAPNVSVGELNIKDGRITVIRQARGKKAPSIYTDVAVTAKNVSMTS